MFAAIEAVLVEIVEQDRVGRLLDEHAEALLARAQRFLGLPALGNIAKEPDPPQVFAVRGLERRREAVDDAAVLENEFIVTGFIRMVTMVLRLMNERFRPSTC